MSNLVVVGFPKAQEAEEVRRELVTIQQEHLIALEDAVVLEHGEDGDSSVAHVLSIQLLDVLGINGFHDLLDTNLVDGLLHLILSPEDLVCRFFLFRSVGIVASNKICGGN